MGPMPDLTPLTRHARVALSFSGGKDSTAVVLLLKRHLPRITVYNVNTGDLLPEMEEAIDRVAAMCPHFVRIETRVADWIATHGLPTDLLPYSQDRVGRSMNEHRGRYLVSRYDCCGMNLMQPLWNRIRADGNTLLIRGTKRADMHTLPVDSGSTHDGVEIWYPLLEWTAADVFDFLEKEKFPLPRLYETMTNAPECARCSAWWTEKRADYLKQHYPSLYADYQARLEVVLSELRAPLTALHAEFHGV